MYYGRREGGLNPLFIRSFYQTSEANAGRPEVLRLNPLFIRSFYQTDLLICADWAQAS